MPTTQGFDPFDPEQGTRHHEAMAEVPGYQFSAAMEAHKGEKWDPEKLNDWLYKPQAFIKGTKMTFAGIPKSQDRADVIAYLETLK